MSSTVPEHCKEKFDTIIKKLDNLEKKLFVDNGGLSHQSKINKNTRDLKIITGIFSAIGTALISVVVIFIKKYTGD